MNWVRVTQTAVLCTSLLAAGLLCAGPESLDTSGPVVETPTASSASTFRLSGEYIAEETYVGESSVRRGHTIVEDFDESDSTLQFIFTPRISLGVLRLGFQYERFSFGFPSQTLLPNTLQSGSAVIGLDSQFSDSILFRVEAQPGFYGTNSFSTSNFSVPFLAGGTYIYNPSLQFIAGVSVDVERQYPVLPTAGIRWKFAPQWVVNAVLPTPRIEYEANRSLTFYGGGVFKETNFRVDQDFAPQLKHRNLGGTVLTYSEVRAGVGADWKITSVLTLTAEAGYQPYRTFDFYRADVEFDQESSAPYGTLSIHGSF
jgi:hypothetical protein